MFVTWIQLAASLLVTEIRSSKVAAFRYGVPLPVVATNWAQQGVLRGLKTHQLCTELSQEEKPGWNSDILALLGRQKACFSSSTGEENLFLAIALSGLAQGWPWGPVSPSQGVAGSTPCPDRAAGAGRHPHTRLPLPGARQYCCCCSGLTVFSVSLKKNKKKIGCLMSQHKRAWELLSNPSLLPLLLSFLLI